MKKLMIILSVVLLIDMVAAQTPDMYKSVHHLLWVVDDLTEVMHSWEQLGFSEIEEIGKIQVNSLNDQSSARAAIGYLNGAKVIWIEPLRGSDPFRTYLRSEGEGVLALIHKVDKNEVIKNETKRLKDKNISTTEQLTLDIKGNKLTYHFFDTGEMGRYIVGLANHKDLVALFNPKKTGENKYGLQFSQYAFATNNPEPVSEFWMKFGLPEMEITKGDITDKMYYGEPGNFKMHLGWQRHGDVVYEWCIPVAGENVYTDHINSKGEGVHHLGFNVANMDSTLDSLKEDGFIISQTGGWGEKGKPGSGRFAYLDPQLLGGIAIELLWNYKE